MNLSLREFGETVQRVNDTGGASSGTM